MDCPLPLTCARSRSGRAYHSANPCLFGTQHAEGHVAPLRLGSIANCRSERVIAMEAYQAASRTHFPLLVPLHTSSTMTLVSNARRTRPGSTKDCPRRVRIQRASDLCSKTVRRSCKPPSRCCPALVRSLGARPNLPASRVPGVSQI